MMALERHYKRMQGKDPLRESKMEGTSNYNSPMEGFYGDGMAFRDQGLWV